MLRQSYDGTLRGRALVGEEQMEEEVVVRRATSVAQRGQDHYQRVLSVSIPVRQVSGRECS